MHNFLLMIFLVSGNGSTAPPSGATVVMVEIPGTVVLPRTFSPELRDPTSSAFKELEQEVCNEVPYKTSNVTLRD